jgi:uncharacterized repeat protein (TIGR03803 family)
MKTMTTNRNTMLAVLCALFLGAANAPAQFNLLHSFAGGNSDGSFPQFGAPTISGSTLYGMTLQGGSINSGTAFKMNTDGTGFTLLHTFTGGGSDGRDPYGSLTLSGSTLYGMTSSGGAADGGRAFKMNTDGTGYTLLHAFNGGVSDGSSPYGSLTLSGSTLYGMTVQGGGNNFGTVFKMNTDGTGFALLHTFTGYSDGQMPFGSLTLDGSTLYGMTTYGGTSGYGTAFKMNTDGTGFTLLHSFAGGVSDGRNPFGSLTLDGSTLYGMTQQGGSSGYGTAFQMNTDGTGFTLLHSFTGDVSDGRTPNGSLTLDGSTLYGMTGYGGVNNLGTAFQMNTNGTGFALLRSFTGVSDGTSPYGSLTLDGSTLYGMASEGGVNNLGTVFSIGVVPEPSSMGMVLLGLGLIGWRRRIKRIGILISGHRR